MKTLNLLLLLLFNLNIYSLYAQIPASRDSTPVRCTWNLKNAIFTRIVHSDHISYAKSSSNACSNVSNAGDVEKTDIGCYPADGCSDCNSSMFYDVYYPRHDFTAVALPAIILAHPGGFAQCSSYDEELMRTLCEGFAKRGFVAFNVEYRRGRIKDPSQHFTSVQQQLAAYRGFQDIRGAIRSIIKRQRLMRDPFIIDTNYIFVGGASAGGYTTLNVAWYTNSMVYDVYSIPSGPTIQNVLGPLDIDYYFGEPTIQYKDKIKGVMVMWSGMPIPYRYRTGTSKESHFFNDYKATLKPLIAFHGSKDPVFPFYTDDNQIVYFSPAIAPHLFYNSENRCLLTGPYTLEGDSKSPDLINASPLNMYNILQDLNPSILKELYVDCDMKHGLDLNDSFKSNFGTSASSQAQVMIYMVERSATFFQAIMNGKTPRDIGQPTKFTECENKRVKCNVQVNTGGCKNEDSCNSTITQKVHKNQPSYSAVASEVVNEVASIKLYPNPVDDRLQIQSLNTLLSSTLSIYNSRGILVQKSTAQAPSCMLNVSRLTPGIYVLQVTNANGTTTAKFVKN